MSEERNRWIRQFKIQICLLDKEQNLIGSGVYNLVEFGALGPTFKFRLPVMKKQGTPKSVWADIYCLPEEEVPEEERERYYKNSRVFLSVLGSVLINRGIKAYGMPDKGVPYIRVECRYDQKSWNYIADNVLVGPHIIKGHKSTFCTEICSAEEIRQGQKDAMKYFKDFLYLYT